MNNVSLHSTLSCVHAFEMAPRRLAAPSMRFEWGGNHDSRTGESFSQKWLGQSRNSWRIAQSLGIVVLIAAIGQTGEVKIDGRTFSCFQTASPSSGSRARRWSIGRSRPHSTTPGRLYVADSSGSNDNVKKQLAEKPHRIVRLEDTRRRRRIRQEDRLRRQDDVPRGNDVVRRLAIRRGAPSIWKLTDTDGDGVADQRVEWFAGKTLTGCANDLHGPYLGPDGWIYWCKGRICPGRPMSGRASHLSSPGRPTSSAAGLMERVSSQS